MREISITELRKLKVGDLKDGPCLKISSDGEFLAYVVMQPEGEMRTRIEAISSQIDASRGV
jgi:hypothetical protein